MISGSTGLHRSTAWYVSIDRQFDILHRPTVRHFVPTDSLTFCTDRQFDILYRPTVRHDCQHRPTVRHVNTDRKFDMLAPTNTDQLLDILHRRCCNSIITSSLSYIITESQALRPRALSSLSHAHYIKCTVIDWHRIIIRRDHSSAVINGHHAIIRRDHSSAGCNPVITRTWACCSLFIRSRCYMQDGWYTDGKPTWLFQNKSTRHNAGCCVEFHVSHMGVLPRNSFYLLKTKLHRNG